MTRGPLVITTIGATEFLARELLRGVAETRILGTRVPRDIRAEPSPDELVLLERATVIVAYGGDADRNSIAMARRAAPDKTILIVREDSAGNGFGWLEAPTLRDDARRLHEQLKTRFDSSRDRSRLDSNLADLEARLAVLEQTMAECREVFDGQRFFSGDRRMNRFLASLGIGIIDTIDVGENGSISEAQRERVVALAGDAPVRILIVTDPEKKVLLAELARQADLTLVFFNPFHDGGTGVGQIDSVIPRQLSVMRLAMGSALAANEDE